MNEYSREYSRDGYEVIVEDIESQRCFRFTVNSRDIIIPYESYAELSKDEILNYIISKTC